LPVQRFEHARVQLADGHVTERRTDAARCSRRIRAGLSARCPPNAATHLWHKRTTPTYSAHVADQPAPAASSEPSRHVAERPCPCPCWSLIDRAPCRSPCRYSSRPSTADRCITS